MNRHLREALSNQSIRQNLKKEIKKVRGRSMNEEYGGGLYKAFVEPFTDVLKSVNVGAQDMLNSFVLHLRTFITFDPKKIEELHRGHDERQSKIAEKWKPLMEKTDAALSTGDADVLALAFAPGVFAVSAIGSTVANYAGDIGTFVDSVGLGGFTDGLIPGSSSTKSSSSEKGGILGGDLLDNLTALFFVGTAGSAVALGLRDSKGVKKEEFKKSGLVLSETPEKDFEKDFASFLDMTGVDDALRLDGSKIFKSLKDTIQEMRSELTARKNLIQEIDKSSSLEEFFAAFEKAYEFENAPKSNVPDTDKIKKQITAAVDTLIAQKQKEVDTKDAPIDEIKKAAEAAIFLDAKKSFQEGEKGAQAEIKNYESMKSDMGERAKEMLPTDAGLKILKTSKTKEAKDVVDFVENTKQFFGI